MCATTLKAGCYLFTVSNSYLLVDDDDDDDRNFVNRLMFRHFLLTPFSQLVNFKF